MRRGLKPSAVSASTPGEGPSVEASSFVEIGDTPVYQRQKSRDGSAFLHHHVERREVPVVLLDVIKLPVAIAPTTSSPNNSPLLRYHVAPRTAHDNRNHHVDQVEGV